MKTVFLLAAAAAAFSAAPALAIVNAPVPTNATITHNGIVWAWANPCDAYGGCGDIDLSYQGPLGWRLPTVAEFALRPNATDFVFAGANVPLGGSDGVGNNFTFGSPGGDAACATAYFSNFYTHCDWGNGAADLWYNPAGGNGGYFETLLVQGDARVPEPATWAMLIVGFGLVGHSLRRRAVATA